MHNMSKQLSCSSINTQPCNAIWTPESKKDVGNLAKLQRNCSDNNNLWNDISKELCRVGIICLTKRRLNDILLVYWGGFMWEDILLLCLNQEVSTKERVDVSHVQIKLDLQGNSYHSLSFVKVVPRFPKL